MKKKPVPEPDLSLIDHIEKIAQELELKIDRKAADYITVWTSSYIGIHLRLRIDEKGFIRFNFYARTYSFFYNGERTDLHDVLPLIFGAELKRSGLCSLIFIDVDNPAIYIEGEIYARYLLPEQIHPGLVHINSVSLDKIDSLISSLAFFEQSMWMVFGGCPCADCRKALGYEYDYRWEDISEERLENIKEVFNTKSIINYCERTLPTWFYFKDIKKRILLIESEGLIAFLKVIKVNKPKSIPSINGELIVDEQFNHYYAKKTAKKILKYFKNLNDVIPDIWFFEGKLLAVGDKYIVVIDDDCGTAEFKNEKEKVRERREKEFDLLFQPSSFQWAEKIDDAVFEELIKDLLEREPNVLRVRKMAHTNERDGGVDLVADWKIPKDAAMAIADKEDPYKIIRVVVQCKAYKNGVSKTDVVDIRDTVENRNYDGYFLAVSSYIKNSLADQLDRMRTTGKTWVDWWTQSEIEDRLKRNEELILKYQSIFKLSQ